MSVSNRRWTSLSLTLFFPIMATIGFFLPVLAADYAHHHNPLPHSHLHSQWREKGEDFTHARDRYHQRLRAAGVRIEARIGKKVPSGRSVASFPATSAEDAALPLSQLDLADIPDWSQVTNYPAIFAQLRDNRFITDPDHVDTATQKAFERRETWLYPDDGCFARAALMGQKIAGMKLARPAKVFAFGNLEVKSSNSPSGSVTWWYHVVNIVRVGGQPIVLDPSIDANAPMTLDSWIDAMATDRNSVQVSICSPYTYTPDSMCQSDPSEESSAISDEDSFLDSEWSRQTDLGRDPYQVLGDSPPWAAQR